MYKIFIKKIREKIKNDVNRLGKSDNIVTSLKETAQEAKNFVSNWLLIEQNDFFDTEKTIDTNLHAEKLPDVQYSFEELVEKGFNDAVNAVQKELSPIQAANYKKIIDSIKKIYTTELAKLKVSSEPEKSSKLNPDETEASLDAMFDFLGSDPNLNPEKHLETSKFLVNYYIERPLDFHGIFSLIALLYKPNSYFEKTKSSEDLKKFVYKNLENFLDKWNYDLFELIASQLKRFVSPLIDNYLHQKNINFEIVIPKMNELFFPHDEEKSLFTPAQINWVLRHYDEEKQPDLKKQADELREKINQSVETSAMLDTNDYAPLFKQLEDYFYKKYTGDESEASKKYFEWIYSVVKKKNEDIIDDPKVNMIGLFIQKKGERDNQVSEYLYNVATKAKNPPKIRKPKKVEKIKENDSLQNFLNRKNFKHPYMTILENIYMKGHVKDVYLKSIKKHLEENNNFYAACNMAIVDVANQSSSIVMNENFSINNIAYGDQTEINNNLNIINHYFSRSLLTPETKQKHPEIENLINRITRHIMSEPFKKKVIEKPVENSMKYYNEFNRILKKCLPPNQVQNINKLLENGKVISDQDKKYILSRAQNQPQMNKQELVYLQKFLVSIKN